MWLTFVLVLSVDWVLTKCSEETECERGEASSSELPPVPHLLIDCFRCIQYVGCSPSANTNPLSDKLKIGGFTLNGIFTRNYKEGVVMGKVIWYCFYMEAIEKRNVSIKV